MRALVLQLTVPDRDADDVYRTLSDFASYPKYSDAVRSVTVTDVADNVTTSSWEVTFRAGLLRWVEEDVFSPERRHIEFRQLSGDVALFEGTWDCLPADGGTTVEFGARLDMGIPSLADALEPIAIRTLVDNTVAILRGLFGPAVSVGRSVIEAAHSPVRVPTATY